MKNMHIDYYKYDSLDDTYSMIKAECIVRGFKRFADAHFSDWSYFIGLYFDNPSMGKNILDSILTRIYSEGKLDIRIDYMRKHLDIFNKEYSFRKGCLIDIQFSEDRMQNYINYCNDNTALINNIKATTMFFYKMKHHFSMSAVIHFIRFNQNKIMTPVNNDELVLEPLPSTGSGDVFKINSKYSPILARNIILKNPDMLEFFELRKVLEDDKPSEEERERIS